MCPLTQLTVSGKLKSELESIAKENENTMAETMRRFLRAGVERESLVECDECGADEIPPDADWCPYCGIEFKEDEEDEEDEEESESETEDEEEEKEKPEPKESEKEGAKASGNPCKDED